MSDELIGADEAAALLGVTKATLYAYVSRHGLTSHPGPGPTRARRYVRSELLALHDRQRTSVTERAVATSLDWGLPVLESGLTLISHNTLHYRGVDVRTLADSATLEEVAALLWGVDHVVIPASGRRTIRPADLTQRLMETLAAREREDLPAAQLSAQMRAHSAAELVGQLFAAAGAAGSGLLGERLAAGWGSLTQRQATAALVLCADHELNASAFTARCAASTGASLEYSLLAALCAFSGFRHGEAGLRVASLLADAEHDGPALAVKRALAEQGRVPGFDHPLYPEGDPRAKILLELLPAKRGDTARRVADLCATRLGVLPDLDFGLAALVRRAGLPGAAAPGIFALGRLVGWTAHVFEAWDSGSLIRPRARYVGPDPEPSGV